MQLFLIITIAHNDNDNEIFIQTKSNKKHHKGNINNTYKDSYMYRSVDCK